jgi:hypothetical protein
MRTGYVKLRLQIAFFLQPLVLRAYTIYMNECAEAFIVCQGDGVSRVGKMIAMPPILEIAFYWNFTLSSAFIAKRHFFGTISFWFFITEIRCEV